MFKKILVFCALAVGIVAGILTFENNTVISDPGRTTSCLSCHSQSTSLNVTTNIASITVAPGQTFNVNISWAGGTNGRLVEINWPNVLSNTQFAPTPRIPYSNTNVSGTTQSTLTAPNTPGTYTVRVFAARGSPRDSDYADIAVNVGAANTAPVLTAIGNQSVLAGQNLQFVISATDANNNPLTYSASGLPTGATFNAATRNFSWTPALNQAGSYPNITFIVSDGSLTDSEAITIAVTTANAAPVLTAIGNQSVLPGQNLQFIISATDTNNDPLTYSSSGLPTGATFNAATRNFSWTPAANQVGIYSNITFQVSDGSLNDSETITITVTAPNAAPVLTTIGNKSVLGGQNLQFVISATDANNDPLTYSASGLPNGATFNTATRNFSWTPSTSQVGTYPGVTFQVTDGTLTDSESITISVAVGNAPPVLNPIGNKSVTVGKLLQFTVSATDPNNDNLSYSASGIPTGATFNTYNRTFSWTPTTSQTGTSGITFRVSDGSLTASESINVVVAANSAPVLDLIGNKTVSAGQSLQFTLTASDVNADPLTFSASSLPSGAIFNIPNQTFSWTPTSNQIGTYSNVTFRVSDGSSNDSETITIAVSATNAAPVLTPIGNKSVLAGQNLLFTISATDVNNNTLTFSASNLPAGATFNAATRTFSWTPVANQVGIYSNVTLVVSDSSLTDSETITVTVTAANGAPVLNTIGNKVANSNQQLQFTVSATDPNNDALTFSASSLPAGAVFTASTQTFAWTPGTSQSGNFVVNFQVSDGGLTDSESVTITVAAPSSTPTLFPVGNKSVSVNQSLQFSIWASDPNNDPLAYTASNLPNGASFNQYTRIFNWVPTSDQIGIHPGVTFQVSDGTQSASETIVISVEEANKAPVLSNIGNKTVRAGEQLEFTATGTDQDNDRLTFSASNLPSGAVFSGGTGTFTWKPSMNQVGSYINVTFQVSDGSLIDVESITIIVNEQNVSPELEVISNTTITAGELLTFAIIASDPNNDSLAYTAIGLPKGAVFNKDTRIFSWKPGLDQTGNFHDVTFTASDGLLTVSKSIDITVVPPDMKTPVVGEVKFAHLEPTSVTIQWTTDESCTSQIEYWDTAHVLTSVDGELKISHQVQLTGLLPDTEYTYLILSRDEAGNLTTSAEHQFSTLPVLTYTNLKIEPEQVESGEEVTISIAVVNNVDTRVTYVIPFRVGGALVATQSIELAPGEKKVVNFTTTRWATGLAKITFDEIEGFFTVIAPERKTTSALVQIAIVTGVILAGSVGLVIWVWRRKHTRS